MAAPRQLPDADTLRRHRDERMTYREIAERYGVTESAVWARLRHDGITTAKRVNHKAFIPWTIHPDHANTYPMLMLRTLSRREQGLDNTPERDRMLSNWLDALRERKAVLCYDPAMWPNPASPRLGGFFYAKRRKSDGGSVIRYAAPGKGLPRKR